MLKVKDIMTQDVVTLTPDQSLREAIDTLVTCHIQGAPVIDGERVVGVLSAPDIMEFESVTPVNSDTEEDEEPEEPEDFAAEEWEEGGQWSSTYFTDLWTRRGPDVAERVAHQQGWDMLSEHTVGEAMSRVVLTLPAGLEVSAAAQRMLASGVQRALVVEDDAFVGILSTTDIMRAVAEHRLTVRQMVFER